ncbi:T9SS type A sorting domain-containing protein [Bacteroidales bacterium OttesenSCG-928-K03]|nr:T9SS type A sorting domain-containing protein [Bacteroidales bacterium OttesenSCG-928-L14]MDL2240257.1 T9SS type A sorting domain-containing protein [Bacteroidales bacterium OttesenSCG-928-K22]MDL2243097.1 T9SS type A sorting domain-containing protein [Bacteroidales bacterium OttesenSCG-928-K03]
MESNKFLKKYLTLIVILISFTQLSAQDVITFTWQSSHHSDGAMLDYGFFDIKATNDEQFFINWGDDSPIETIVGLGDTKIHLYHSYDYYDYSCTVTITASNADCNFTYFDCNTYYEDDVVSFSITKLTLKDCSDLSYLSCHHNSLKLFDLYAANLIINDQNGKLFGTQYLPYQALTGGMSVDFSDQKEFGGVETVFVVYKEFKQATIDIDYTINNGIITFINDGEYRVDMTNSAIITHPDCSACVIAGMDLTKPGGISENPSANFKIYPNPTNNFVYIKTEDGIIPEVKVYSLNGKLLQQAKNTEIDLSNYTAGIYILSIDGKMVKVVKQ